MFKKKIFKYIKSFGVFHGIKIFFTVRRTKNMGTVEFKVPGLTAPIFIRRSETDFIVFEEIFIDNIYSLPASPDSVQFIIDAGANIGLSALFFLKRFPKAKIICVEPEEKNFSLLQLNTKEYSNIIPIKNALWHNSSYLKIQDSLDASWAFQVIETNQEESEFSGISISDIVTKFHLPKIDLLKIDIEGSEKEVFEKNNSWISLVKDLIVEIHESTRSGAHKAVFNLIEGNNFSHFEKGSNHIFSKK